MCTASLLFRDSSQPILVAATQAICPFFQDHKEPLSPPPPQKMAGNFTEPQKSAELRVLLPNHLQNLQSLPAKNSKHEKEKKQQ